MLVSVCLQRNSNIYDADLFTRGNASDVMVSAVLGRGSGLVRNEIEEAEEFLRALPDMAYGIDTTQCSSSPQSQSRRIRG